MTGTDVVADRSRRSKGWSGVLMGAVVAGMGSAFGGAGLGLFGDGTPNVLGGAFGGLFVLVGGGMLISGARNLWLHHLLGTPTLTVPPAEPLRLGGVLVARFERRGGTRRAERATRLSAELVGQESATYRQGTDDHTVTHEIYRQELPTTLDGGRPVRGQVQVNVPVGVPPSMALRHNSVIWSVRIRVEAPGVPVDESSFVVRVVPALAAAVLEDPGAAGPGTAGVGR